MSADKRSIKHGLNRNRHFRDGNEIHKQRSVNHGDNIADDACASMDDITTSAFILHEEDDQETLKIESNQ